MARTGLHASTILFGGAPALIFGSSSKLANAYGIAVAGTMVAMVVTALLAIIVISRNRGWRRSACR